jgi:hypothetical protein
MRNGLDMLRSVFGRLQRRDQPRAGAVPPATTSATSPPSVTTRPVPAPPSTTPPDSAVPSAETNAALSAAQDAQASAEPAAIPPIVEEIVVGPVGQTKVIAHSAEEVVTPAMPPALDTPPATALEDELATEPPAEGPPTAESPGDHSLPEASAQEALSEPALGLSEPPTQTSVPTSPSTTAPPGGEDDSGHEP